MCAFLRVIYYIKPWMYGHQQELDGYVRAKLQRMVTFVARLYKPAWLACPVAVDAPVNDIQLHQDLLQFKAVDGEVAEAALAVVTAASGTSGHRPLFSLSAARS